MRRLASYFLRGLAFGAPLAVTIYVCYRIFTAIDGWMGLPIPGLGFVVTIALFTLIGFLGSTFLATSALSTIDRAVERLPFVRLLYSATKDLLNAFVGEHRRFDAPVMVPADGSGTAKALGFITQDSLEHLGLADYVTVYVPFSYSLSGRLLMYPASQVTKLHSVSSDVLAFIISGGVTEVPTTVARTSGPQSGADGVAPLMPRDADPTSHAPPP